MATPGRYIDLDRAGAVQSAVHHVLQVQPGPRGGIPREGIITLLGRIFPGYSRDLRRQALAQAVQATRVASQLRERGENLRGMIGQIPLAHGRTGGAEFESGRFLYRVEVEGRVQGGVAFQRTLYLSRDQLATSASVEQEAVQLLRSSRQRRRRRPGSPDLPEHETLTARVVAVTKDR